MTAGHGFNRRNLQAVYMRTNKDVKTFIRARRADVDWIEFAQIVGFVLAVDFLYQLID